MMARKNMSTGPMSQFCRRERPRMRQLRKTSPSSSYRTLAKGGYIIKIRPAAMGREVVPTVKDSVKSATPGQKYPKPTPTAMARNIQSVRNRSRRDNLRNPILDDPASACVLSITSTKQHDQFQERMISI